MKCIYCFKETDVTNSRPKKLEPSIWRRRQCKMCVAQFSTNELPVYSKSIVVKGIDNKLYPFSRDKLFLSLYRSLGHRKDALNCATELTHTTIAKLLRSTTPNNGVFTSNEVSNISYSTLKRFDRFASSSYRAYHKSTLG